MRINSDPALREMVLSRGCYSKEENERIFSKWFRTAPRYLFRAVDKKYHIADRRLCDVGCEYGVNLPFCAPGSYGLEIDPYAVRFAESLGLKVYRRDVARDDLADLPKVEAVWCSAMLEHVDSPHVVLRKLHYLLEPGGIVCVYVPTVSPISFLRHLPRVGKYLGTYSHGDHVNAFTPGTLKFMCERAGFSTIECSSFLPFPLSVLDRTTLVDGVVYVGRRPADWDYPRKSTRKAVPGGDGYVFK